MLIKTSEYKNKKFEKHLQLCAYTCTLHQVITHKKNYEVYNIPEKKKK